MTRIYLVYDDDEENPDLRALFSTEQKAQAWIGASNLDGLSVVTRDIDISLEEYVSHRATVELCWPVPVVVPYWTRKGEHTEPGLRPETRIQNEAAYAWGTSVEDAAANVRAFKAKVLVEREQKST